MKLDADIKTVIQSLKGKDLWVSVIGKIPATGWLSKYNYYIRILDTYSDTSVIVANVVNAFLDSQPELSYAESHRYLIDLKDIKLGYVDLCDYFRNADVNISNGVTYGLDIMTTEDLFDLIEHLSNISVDEG